MSIYPNFKEFCVSDHGFEHYYADVIDDQCELKLNKHPVDVDPAIYRKIVAFCLVTLPPDSRLIHPRFLRALIEEIEHAIRNAELGKLLKLHDEDAGRDFLSEENIDEDVDYLLTLLKTALERPGESLYDLFPSTP